MFLFQLLFHIGVLHLQLWTLWTIINFYLLCSVCDFCHSLKITFLPINIWFPNKVNIYGIAKKIILTIFFWNVDMFKATKFFYCIHIWFLSVPIFNRCLAPGYGSSSIYRICCCNCFWTQDFIKLASSFSHYCFTKAIFNAILLWNVWDII